MLRIKELFIKYHLDFWGSVVGKTTLMIIAIISGFISSPSYFSLAIMYALILVIRIPSFFMDQHINRKYEDDLEKQFQRKHLISLYTAILILIDLTVLVPINYFIPSTVISASPMLMMYIIFVPWAVIRTGFEIFRIIKYRKTSNPYIRAKTIINIFCALGVITKLFGDLYLLHSDIFAFAVTATVLALFTLLYTFISFIYLLIISIRGLLNKRHKAFERYTA